ncbi:MAG: type 4a pilus biogenesis protein PilO [Actinomycetota bacterium]|nr:type 4a pilus biogenesis protein PilO [Actinomycetota bacterium]
MTGKTKMILSVVGVIAVGAAIFFFAIKPRQDELGKVRNQVSREEDRTQSLEAELAHRQQLQKNAPQLEAQIAKYRELVPEDDQVANFIFQVQEAANQSGVGFVEITPDLPTPPAEGAQVAEVDAIIGARGGYFAVQDFFRRLYGLDRAVRIDEVTMDAEEDQTTQETLVKLGATARIFFELPAGAAVPTATDTTTTDTTTPAPEPTS